MRILSIDRAKQKAKGPSHGGSPARGRNRIRAGSSTPDGSRLSPTPSLASGIFGAAYARAATSHAFASDISQTVFVLGSLPIPAAARTHARAAFAAFVLVAVLLAGFPSTASPPRTLPTPHPPRALPQPALPPPPRTLPPPTAPSRWRPTEWRRPWKAAPSRSRPFPAPRWAATARRAKATRAIATTSPASPAAWWPSLPKA